MIVVKIGKRSLRCAVGVFENSRVFGKPAVVRVLEDIVTLQPIFDSTLLECSSHVQRLQVLNDSGHVTLWVFAAES